MINIEIHSLTIDDKQKISAELRCKQPAGDGTIEIQFAELLPYTDNSIAVDFFFIASLVYGIDRFIDRYTYSVDGWSRELHVSFPVYNLKQWNALKVEVEQMLSFLTGDYWHLSFYENQLKLPKHAVADDLNIDFDQVALFSGGLDSLIGSIDYLIANPNRKLIVVSHFDPNISARKEQIVLKQRIKSDYENQFFAISSISVGLSNTNFPKKETTFRSRSLLFLGMAVLVAHKTNLPIMVPENGTVSLNYPLSPSRRSACSTRTTHPTFIKKVNELLIALGINSVIKNPYDLKTKGEMISECKNLDYLKQLYIDSISCGKRGHVVNWTDKYAGQCGVCMPCIYRRASLYSISDLTVYGNSINKQYTGRVRQTPFLLSKQGQDFAACLKFLSNKQSNEEIRNELLINGVIEMEKLDGFVELIKRSKKELLVWIGGVGTPGIKNKAGIS